VVQKVAQAIDTIPMIAARHRHPQCRVLARKPASRSFDCVSVLFYMLSEIATEGWPSKDRRLVN